MGPMFGRSLFMELRMSDLGGFCVERRGVPAVDDSHSPDGYCD